MNEPNPYEASSAAHFPLTFRQQLLAATVGIVVFASSVIIMLALQFGIMVAFAGRSQPTPVSLPAILSSRLGTLATIGVIAIVPVSLLLGTVSALRVLRIQRTLADAERKRFDLRENVENLRRSLSREKESDAS